MATYQWALGNGEIMNAEYDASTDTLSNDQVCSELRIAFSQFGHQATCTAVSEQIHEVYKVSFVDDTQRNIIICAKGTTPGGRATLALQDEQRTQQRSRFINYAYQQKEEGNIAVQLGVYKRDGQTIFCAWKLKKSNASDDNTTISKQIKITTIAQAMKEGFGQQSKGGEYACAFRKEFIFFYINNADWLHDGLVNELAEHTAPIEDFQADIMTEKRTPEEQEKAFREWLVVQRNLKDKDGYSTRSAGNFISDLKKIYTKFGQSEDSDSVFQIQDVIIFSRFIAYLRELPEFNKFVEEESKGTTNQYMNALNWYKQFLMDECDLTDVIFENILELDTQIARNLIVFGAPGTGKSYKINKARKDLLGENSNFDYERVTFHPDYSYAHFVGTYKPEPCLDSDDKDAITYEYVPGPFMRVYVKAIKNLLSGEKVRPFLLIIEEINRANVAGVFGDVFQLLDRDENGISQYPVEASKDMRMYLASELDRDWEKYDKYDKIYIPSNMFIWATMNSADQGVFPIDTAFKRRWDFDYLPINTGENDKDNKDLKEAIVPLGKEWVKWSSLRHAINDFLAKQGINEDKQLGTFFINKDIIVNAAKGGKDVFIETFKNKVIMYLFEDAAKHKREELFGNRDIRYSQICANLDTDGKDIFSADSGIIKNLEIVETPATNTKFDIGDN